MSVTPTALLELAYPEHSQYVTTIVRNTPHHAYCFIGTEYGAQHIAATAVAQQSVCANGGCGSCVQCTAVTQHTHPDVRVIRALEGKQRIGVEQAKEVRHHLALAPSQAAHRLVIIHNVHQLTEQAANALLKIIEEPPQRALLLLTTHMPQMLPATVRSRMQSVRFPALSHQNSKEILKRCGMSPEFQERYSHRAGGELALLERYATEDDFRQAQQEYVDFWLNAIQAPVAERDALITNTLLKNKETIHTVPTVIDTIEMILHDALVERTNAGSIRLQDRKDALQAINAKRTGMQLSRQLEAVDELRKMCHDNTNKKMIVEYLINHL